MITPSLGTWAVISYGLGEFLPPIPTESQQLQIMDMASVPATIADEAITIMHLALISAVRQLAVASQGLSTVACNTTEASATATVKEDRG